MVETLQSEILIIKAENSSLKEENKLLKSTCSTLQSDIANLNKNYETLAIRIGILLPPEANSATVIANADVNLASVNYDVGSYASVVAKVGILLMLVLRM